MNASRFKPFLLLATLLVGCVDPDHDSRLTHAETPTDFALEFYVLGDPKAPDAIDRPAQFVLEPNLRFHVAQGTVTRDNSFPPLLRSLTPAEQESLYALVRDAGLVTRAVPQTQPSDDSGTLYHLTVMARGTAYTSTIDPAVVPASTDVLQRLYQLAGADPLAYPAPHRAPKPDKTNRKHDLKH